MITKGFIESMEYNEFKSILIDSLQNKAVDIKTEGKTNEMIAREVTAYETAAKMVEKVIRKFERQVSAPLKDQESWK